MLRSGTLLSAARKRHSLSWERRRIATPFYQKERCGSGTPFFRAGARAALFSPSLSFLLFFFLFLTFLFSPWKGGGNIFNKKTCKKKFLNGTFVKVHIFWESHKCLSYVESNLRWGFRKILWPSQNIWSLIIITKKLVESKNYSLGYAWHFHEFQIPIFLKSDGVVEKVTANKQDSFWWVGKTRENSEKQDSQFVKTCAK